MSKQIFTNGHALIIGVQTYLPYAGDLPCTLADAKGLTDLLKDEERCAYPPEQVLLLTDSKADRNGILTAFDELAKVTGSDSMVVFYFSGHGGVKEGAYHFCPHGYNPAALADTAISGEEFTRKIAAIPARKKLILLDCCHAGGVSGIKDTSFTKASVPPEAIELFKQGKGYVVIASSQEDEFSYVGKPYSMFTSALLEALCGKGVAKKDGYVRAADLAMYTRERVVQLTKDKEYPQHPVLHFEQADNFVLAYYAGGEGTPKSIPFTLEAEVTRRPETVKHEDSIKAIEGKFIRADYIQAYEDLYHLCCDRQECKEFSSAAMSILAKYNELERNITSMTIDSDQQETRKREISTAFITLLNRMKNSPKC